jgi:hypothetical protein
MRNYWGSLVRMTYLAVQHLITLSRKNKKKFLKKDPQNQFHCILKDSTTISAGNDWTKPGYI